MIQLAKRHHSGHAHAACHQTRPLHRRPAHADKPSLTTLLAGNRHPSRHFVQSAKWEGGSHACNKPCNILIAPPKRSDLSSSSDHKQFLSFFAREHPCFLVANAVALAFISQQQVLSIVPAFPSHYSFSRHRLVHCPPPSHREPASAVTVANLHARAVRQRSHVGDRTNNRNKRKAAQYDGGGWRLVTLILTKQRRERRINRGALGPVSNFNNRKRLSIPSQAMRKI